MQLYEGYQITKETLVKKIDELSQIQDLDPKLKRDVEARRIKQ